MTADPRPGRVVWTLIICTGLSLLGDTTMYAVLPSQYVALGLLPVHVGWMLSVNRLVRLPLNMVSGWLSDRFGGRLPYVAGLGIGAVSTLGYGLSGDVWVLLFFRALWGVAWAFLAVAAFRMVLDVTTERTRGKLVSVYNSGAFLAGALGALLGGVLTDWLDFRATMIILGALTGLGFLGALTLPNTARSHQRAKAGGARAAAPTGQSGKLRAWVRGLNPRVLAISLLNFAHRFIFAGVLYGTLGLYLRSVLGEEVTVGAAAIGVASLTALFLFLQNVLTMVVSPGSGHLSDRLGDRSLVVLLGEVLGVVGLIWFALGGSLITVALGTALVATVYGVIPPLVMAWMGDLSGERQRGSAVGIYQTMGDLGSGLGPLVAYWALAAVDIRWVYGFSAVAVALTIPLILAIRGRSRTAVAAPAVD